MFGWIGKILASSAGPRRSVALASEHEQTVAEAEACKNRGNACLARGDREGAADCYREAIALDPGYPEAFNNLGIVLHQLGRLADAETALRRALALRPAFAAASLNLGNLLGDQERFAEAESAYRDALAMQPDYASAWLARGDLYRRTERLEPAIECCRQALNIDPLLAAGENNLGIALQEAGRHDEALEHFDRALALDPELQEAQWNWMCAPLLAGDYATGLPRYEQRFAIGTHAERAMKATMLSTFDAIPRWHGEALGEERRLLLWSEQGAGDTLMMLRYLPIVAQRWQTTPALACEPALVSLVQSSFTDVGAIHAKGRDQRLDGYACHCPLMSLPLICGTRIDGIPRQIPYLHVPVATQERWRPRLAELPGLRVGIVWAGNPALPKDALRSLPLSVLAPLFEVDGVRFVSLQIGESARQLAASGLAVANWMSECTDYLDTASLVANLDLVIGVDTSVAHLAGALGKPVWLLNRRESEWRWLLGREASPWYPTMRIFNQPRHGDWGAVAADVAAALAAAVADPSLLVPTEAMT